jgi:phosphopantetheinyl transferase (holo-ACP synthase)
VQLSGKAMKLARRLGVGRVLVSLAHTHRAAIAHAILLRGEAAEAP